jgi:hypothetical protein
MKGLLLAITGATGVPKSRAVRNYYPLKMLGILRPCQSNNNTNKLQYSWEKRGSCFQENGGS